MASNESSSDQKPVSKPTDETVIIARDKTNHGTAPVPSSHFAGAAAGETQATIPQTNIYSFDLTALPSGDHLQLFEIVGKGGMSVVHRAWDRNLERSVAVKQLQKKFVDNSRMAQAFLSEAKIIAFLQHPGIPPIYEVVKDGDNLPQLVMPLLTSDLWTERIKNQTRKEKIQIVQRIAEVIAYAHAHGVIHRDIKPSNVILGSYGEVLVIDWGLAIHVADEGNLSCASESRLWYPQYLAPEVARGIIITPSIDIYGLGAVLFESLTGKPPHPMEDAQAAIRHAKNGLLAEYGDPEKDEVLAVALKCLQAEPDQRYSSVPEFQQALAQAMEHEEARLLLTMAEESAALAEENEDCYDLFQNALFRFREVQDLWPDNKIANEKLSACQVAYAQAACERGDYDLAISILDQNDVQHRSILEQVLEAKKKRAFKDAEVARQQQYAELAADHLSD